MKTDGDPTDMVRREVGGVVRSQGGTTPTGGNLAAPKSTPQEGDDGGPRHRNQVLNPAKNEWQERDFTEEDNAYSEYDGTVLAIDLTPLMRRK